MENFLYNLLISLSVLMADICNDKLIRKLNKKEENKLKKLRDKIDEFKNSHSIEDGVTVLINTSLRSFNKYVSLNLNNEDIIRIANDLDITCNIQKWVFEINPNEEKSIRNNIIKKIVILLSKGKDENDILMLNNIAESVCSYIYEKILLNAGISRLRSELYLNKILLNVEDFKNNFPKIQSIVLNNIHSLILKENESIKKNIISIIDDKTSEINNNTNKATDKILKKLTSITKDSKKIYTKNIKLKFENKQLICWIISDANKEFEAIRTQYREGLSIEEIKRRINALKNDKERWRKYDKQFKNEVTKFEKEL